MLRRELTGAMACAAAFACLLQAEPSAAAGRVLTAGGSQLLVREARVALARAPKWTTAWVSLDVEGGPGRFVLVLPAAAGTKLDPSLDAFFSAIDASTAPRVRPPKPVLACGATSDSSVDDTSEAHAGTLTPSSVAVLDDLTALDSFASQQGVAFGADDAARLGSAGAARFVAVVYDLAQAAATTETLRVSSPLPSVQPGLALLASDGVPEVKLFNIAEGRTHLPSTLDEVGAAEIGSEWQVLSGTSSYAEDRRAFLLAQLGGAAVVESSGSTPLFGWNVLPGGAGAIAPGAKSYFERAKKEGASVSSPDLCLEPVWSAISAGKTGARLSRVCAAGSLVTVPGGSPPCDETPAAGELSGAALRCGDAHDLAFALSGMRADLVRITRHTTAAGPATPLDVALTTSDGPMVSLLVTATSANSAGCTGGSGGAGGTTGGAGYAGYGGDGGLGASTGYYDPNPIPEPEPHVDVQCWAEIGDTCSGGGAGGSDGDTCSGDSSSSDSEGDTCSGDSSSSGDEGDTCGGDSSGSAEGDTCSGDSSSGAEGDTCSGDSGGSGDSCGSGSGSSGGGDCSLPRRPRRLRVSALSMLFFAIALPLRRLGRQRRRRG